MPSPESQGVGIGFIAFNRNKVLYQASSNIGEGQLVYNGELEAITQAVKYSNYIAKSSYKYRVFADNQAALYRLKAPSVNPG